MLSNVTGESTVTLNALNPT